MKTQTIAGHEFTLAPGRRYLAGRPMLGSGVDEHALDVSIRDVTDRVDLDAEPVAIVPGLSYDAANELINAFNNDPRGSFLGRTW